MLPTDLAAKVFTWPRVDVNLRMARSSAPASRGDLARRNPIARNQLPITSLAVEAGFAHHPESGEAVDFVRFLGECPASFSRPAGLAMRQGRVRPGDYLVPGLVGAPPEIHPVAVQRQLRGQATELTPYVATDQHSCGRPTQHRFRDLLPLVDVTVVDDGDTSPRRGDRLPDLRQGLGVIAAAWLEQLRVQNGRSRPGCALQ